MIAELLAVLPADYDSVTFLDIGSMLGDPELKEALERQGVLATLGPVTGLVKERVDAMVLAPYESGALVVLRGPLDAEALIDSLKAPDSEVESERYGGFDIFHLTVQYSFFSLSVPIAILNDTTAVFAISFSAANPGVDAVKAALDAVGGSQPNLLSDPALDQLVNAVGPGFSVVVNRGCDASSAWEGCTGVAISQMKEGEYVISHEVVGFTGAELAEAALPAIREQTLGDVREPSELLEVTQEGNLVRVRVKGDISTVILGTGD